MKLPRKLKKKKKKKLKEELKKSTMNDENVNTYIKNSARKVKNVKIK